MNTWAELKSILEGMDVPAGRKTDLGWLSRNLAFRNVGHKDFNRAMELIRELLKSQYK
jgi:hypothetical protein